MSTTTALDNAQTFPKARNAAFAGRIGGNQEFIASSDNRSLLQKQPDAAPLQSISASLTFKSFADREIWRLAFVECIGTMLLTYLLGAAAIGLTTLEQSLFAKTLYASLTQWLGLSIFILCLGPVTGGHLNPAISMGAFFAGLATLPRTLLYIGAQSVGAIVAGYWLKLSAGSANYFPIGVIPGCTVDTMLISPGQMFATEFMFGFAEIFMSFGVGLDPRQAKTYGAALAPILVGVTLALCTLCSAILRPGYSGVSLNPARCLGLMTAKNELQYHWIHWLAALAATSFNSFLYHAVPPWQDRQRP